MAAIGVELRSGLLLLPLLLEGVGVASGVANREFRGGGGVAYEAEERRPRRRRVSPGDENVFPMGLDIESSGEEGPV